MFDALCTYPLPSDLFAQAIHPTGSLIAIGLASGKVQLNRLPASNPSPPSKKNGPAINTIATQWHTHRHKGSCRSLCFSHDGAQLFSTGTDGIVKVAATETGKVGAKIAVPFLHNGNLDSPTLLHPLIPQTLLLATDSSALYLYDLRANSSTPESKPSQTHHPHADYVTSVASLPSPPTAESAGASASATQWLSTGGTTVAITDIRRGVLVQSEDQGEELLSSTLSGNKVVVGGEKGVLRTWEVGVWDDNETTVTVGPRGGASADVLVSCPGEGGVVAVGMDDGNVRFVDLSGKRGRVLEDEEVKHDEVEGVLGLGFVSDGRMVSGGGSVVKIWEERKAATGGEEDELEDQEDGDEDGIGLVGGKRRGEDGDSDEEDGGEESDEDEPQRRKKKRKRGKGKATGGGGKAVMGFKGLD